jgi:hypothetical protein
MDLPASGVAFPTGKQNGDFFQKLYLADRKIIKWRF